MRRLKFVPRKMARGAKGRKPGRHLRNWIGNFLNQVQGYGGFSKGKQRMSKGQTDEKVIEYQYFSGQINDANVR